MRIDPTAHYEQVSLTDLALLTQDPATLAGMLLRLTEDDVNPAEISGEEALSRKFSDVAILFGALDPRVSRVMFGKLARAVLDLQPEQRQSLLRKTILPGSSTDVSTATSCTISPMLILPNRCACSSISKPPRRKS